MKILTWRDAAEYYLLGLAEKYPDSAADAESMLYADISTDFYPISDKLVASGFPVIPPDFFDTADKPRLLLSTMAQTLSIPQYAISQGRPYSQGSDTFWSAFDFTYLTRRKYADDTGEMGKLYSKSWREVCEGMPPELEKSIEKGFTDTFGPELAKMQPIGTDENGSEVYDIAEIAQVLGLTEDQLIAHAEEMERQGLPSGFFSMPESGDGPEQ